MMSLLSTLTLDCPVTSNFPIPEPFARHTLDMHGERGRGWLAALPALIAECERRWSVTIQLPFPDLSYHYVAPALGRATGEEFVVKVGVPTPDLLGEMETLRYYAGRGMVRLAECDPSQGTLLLERLRPGTSLLEVADDDRAATIAVELMKRYLLPPPLGHSFPTVAQWAGGLSKLRPYFGGTTGPFPERLVVLAEILFRELLAPSTPPLLLHGDLHHGNILAAAREPWLAIDPQGVVGDPAFEIGAFLLSPLPQLLAWHAPEVVMARRLAIFSEALGIARDQLAAWGVARAVLSAWWSVEDHGYGWEPALACADLLVPLL